MTAAKLQQLNQILMIKIQKLQEEREHDVRELQERIDYLEKREAKLLAELEWREEVVRRMKGGEGVAMLMQENQKLRDMVDEMEKLLATQELHFEQREKALTAERNASHSSGEQMCSSQELICSSQEVTSSQELLQDTPQDTLPEHHKKKLARSRSKQPLQPPPKLENIPQPFSKSLEELPHAFSTPATPTIHTAPPTPTTHVAPPTPLTATPPVPHMPESSTQSSFKLHWCPEEYISVKMVRGDTAYDSNTGDIYFSCSRSPFIHSYHPDSGEWSRLQPPCPHLFFGMSLVRGRVTAVGGQEGPHVRATLLSYVEGEEEEGGGGRRRKRNTWLEQLPAMPTKRFNLTAVTLAEGRREERLLTIGGLGHNGAALDCVEVLSVETEQWSSVASLPRPADMLCACVADNQLYLLGASHTRRVYTCYLPYLLQTTPTQTLEVWFQLPATPTNSPTAIILDNQLLLVGGFNEKGLDSNEVFLFQQQERRWKIISHMSTACNKPLLASLHDNKLMVVGGSTKVNHMMNVVQTAEVLLSGTITQY